MLKFREWFYLTEGINYSGLIKMWKKVSPTETDQAIRGHIDQIAQTDPTPNKEYTNWLVREVLNRRLRLPEDEGIIQPDLIYFHDLKRRNQLRRLQVEPSIDKYTRHNFQDMVDGLRAKDVQSKRQEQEEIKAQGAEKLYTDETWMVIKATTAEACTAYGKGTRWCTASTKSNMANHYLHTGPIYVIWKDRQPYAQLHVATSQLMDPRDAAMEPKSLPEDLKDILFRVVPKETEKDHVFFYRMTGQMEPRVQEEAAAATQVIHEKDGWRATKATNTMAALLLISDTDIDEIIKVAELRPFYALAGDGGIESCWQFYLSDTDSSWGMLWEKRSEGKFYSAPIGRSGYDERQETKLGPEHSKVANEAIQPNSVHEALALFMLTRQAHPRSDAILLDFVRQWTMEDLRSMQYDTTDRFHATWIYFAYHRSDHPELFQVVKEKIEDLKSTVKRDEEERQADLEKNWGGKPEYEKMSQRLKRSSLYRSKQNRRISGMHELMGRVAASNPSPEVMNHLLDVAKQGDDFPLYAFWEQTCYLLLRKEDDYEDDDKPIAEAPWGPDGWREAEPYIARFIAHAREGMYHGTLNKYIKLTSSPKETYRRMEWLIGAAVSRETERRQKEREEEDAYL